MRFWDWNSFAFAVAAHKEYKEIHKKYPTVDKDFYITLCLLITEEMIELGMQDEPVSPALLSQKVSERLKSAGF